MKMKTIYIGKEPIAIFKIPHYFIDFLVPDKSGEYSYSTAPTFKFLTCVCPKPNYSAIVIYFSKLKKSLSFKVAMSFNR